KLISAVLALVTMALLFIGVASALVMRSSLLDGVDRQLKGIAETIDESLRVRSLDIDPGANFLVSIGRGGEIEDRPRVSKRPVAELPRMPQGADIGKHLGGFYTEKARGTHERWRLHAVRISTGHTLVVGKSLADVDGTVDDLIAAELVIGA